MHLTLDEYEENSLMWAKERGILQNSSPKTQYIKLMEEAGELASNLLKGKSTKDDIGDMLVVLSLLANLEGTSLGACWEVAWNDIKDRKGFLMPDGNFVKTGPLPGMH